jgi:hypothetical protein
MKLEDKLTALAGCGITLAPKYTVQDVLDREDRAFLDETDLLMFLYILGLRDIYHGDGDQLFGSLSQQVHTFDTECVEGAGSYATLIAELAGMTQGALAISAIDDEVDYDQKGAQLGFTCNGQRVRLTFDQDADWFNPLVVECLGALLNASGAPLKLFYMDTGDQCAMTGCLLPDQIAKLNALGVATSVYDQALPMAGCTVTAE